MVERVTLILLSAMATAVACAQSVTLSAVVTSSASSGGGTPFYDSAAITTLSQSRSAGAGAARGGKYAATAGASLQLKWRVRVSWSGYTSSTPTITSGLYSFLRSDFAYSEVETFLMNSNADAYGGVGVATASSAVSGSNYDAYYTGWIDTAESGSLAGVTLSYDATTGTWIVTKDALTSTANASVSLTPSGLGHQLDRTSLGAEVKVSSFQYSVSISGN